MHLPRAFVALRHRDFRLFWSGQLVSLTGTWMQGLAQGWLVLTLTNSAFLLGLVNAAASVPILLFTLFGGVLADRYDKRRVLIAAQSLLMVQAAVLAALTLLHVVAVWQILLLALFLGTVNAVEVPTRQAFAVELVGKDDLQNAISLNSTAFNATRLVGPSVAGIVVGAAGVGACFALNAVSFLAVLAGLLLMRGPFPPARRGGGSPFHELREGLAYVRHHPAVRGLVLNISALSIFGMPYAVLMPMFARDLLHGGPRLLGLLSSSAGAGALVSAIVLASRGSGQPHFAARSRVILAGGLTVGAALVVLALARSVWAAALLLALIGASAVAVAVTTNTLLQSLAPDRLRARVMSVHVVTFLGLMPFGALLAGSLAGAIGVPGALIVDGAIFFAAAVCFGFFVVPLGRREAGFVRARIAPAGSGTTSPASLGQAAGFADEPVHKP